MNQGGGQPNQGMNPQMMGQMGQPMNPMMMQQMMANMQSQRMMGQQQQPQMQQLSPQQMAQRMMAAQQSQRMMAAQQAQMQQQNPMMMQQMMANMQKQMAAQQKMGGQPQMGGAPNKPRSPSVQSDNKLNNPAVSPKAMEIQKMQIEKMKQAMQAQMSDLQRTGRSALGGDYYQIEGILSIFGCIKQDSDEILANFKKNKIKDTDLKNLDLSDDKLLKKLIPNNEEMRKRFIAWVRYDVKKLHIHSMADDEKKDNNNNDEVVTLNISGIKYTTLKSVLLRTGSTFFSKLFSSNPDKYKCLMDNDNNYFIDRNGRIFEVILEYLQHDVLRCDVNAKYTIDDVRNELKYYDIQLPNEYDAKSDKYLPDSFRFEYCCMYNQLQQFFASQFRILPKNESVNVLKNVGDLPKDMRDIELFLALKNKLINLGYKLKDTQVFRGDPSQWVWTYVETYQRVLWKKK